MVRLLLAHGADPLAKDNGEQTPLDLAREFKQAEIVQILEKKRKR